jgi:hypothetical protein
MVSYGIRPGVEWYWDGFPRTQYPVNIGWLPGIGYEEDADDDEWNLSDGWWEQNGYGNLSPKMGSPAITSMMYGVPEYWPDLAVSTIDTPHYVNFQTNISNGPRAAVNAHPTYWPSGLYVSGYIRDMTNDTSIYTSATTTLSLAGALVSSPGITQVGMKTSQPVGPVTIRFTVPSTWTYNTAKNIKFWVGYMGAWSDSWAWDSIKVTGLRYNGTDMTSSYLISDLAPLPGSGTHATGVTFPVDGVFGLRIEHVAPGVHGLPNFFVHNIEWTANVPTAMVPVHPPQQAATWTDVLQVLDQRDIHCWFGFDDPQRYDFFHPNVLGDINMRGLDCLNLGWTLNNVSLQQVTSAAVASGTQRNVATPGYMNVGLNAPAYANPPYTPIYCVDTTNEGSTMGSEIVTASSGTVFVGIIVPGGLLEATFNGYTTLSAFLSSLLTTIGISFPSATIHFVSTGLWDQNVATTLLDFNGSSVSVGGDNLWRNDSQYSSGVSNVFLDSSVCKPLCDVMTTTPSTYSWGNLVTLYGDNPTITPVPDKTTEWPVGDVYRHLIGKSTTLGSFTSVHIVDLSHCQNYVEGNYAYSSFDAISVPPTPASVPTVPVWHKYWASEDV